MFKHLFHPFSLSLISGFLFWLGWPVHPLPVFLFVALVPLLLIEEQISQGNYRRPALTYFGYMYLATFLWNATTTWWVYQATLVGAIFMLAANAALMTLPFVLFRATKRSGGSWIGYFSFVLYWISFEYLHLNWDLSWPWLTLGNGFAMLPQWVQWYEYSGVLGGTLWILLANIAIFKIFFKKNRKENKKVKLISLLYPLLLIVLPIVYSSIHYHYYQEKGEQVEIVVLQPNIDPYTEKFIGSARFIPYEQQVARFINLSGQKITDQTQFLVWPETAIDNPLEESVIRNYKIIEDITTFKNTYPNLSLLTGITSFSTYRNKKEATPTARFSKDVGYYDVFNTALFSGDTDTIGFYHKSKLVPGVEIMPYPRVFGFISELLFDLGGTAGGFGRQRTPTVFKNSKGITIAPAICYESVYGEYMAGFIRQGARFIFIITNDGWWGNTPGYKQHLHYATLRAIESRRSIARSANTGISAYINQRGDITAQTRFWEQNVISASLAANSILTFYVRYGDYIGRTTIWLAVLVIVSAFVKKKVKK